MRVIFLTEGSSQLGLGHVTRCISLYQAFEEVGLGAVIFVQGDSLAEAALSNVRYRMINWQREWEEIKHEIKKFDIVVVDSYLADLKIYMDISNSYRACLYIDDFKRLGYPKGIVLNGSICAEDISYPKSKNITYLLGSKFIPLRKAFWTVNNKNIVKKAKHLLITFGGSGKWDVISQIVQATREVFPDFELSVITSRNHESTDRRFSNERIKIFGMLSAEEVRELMLSADIAISAGGQTTYELARVGVPSVLVAVADNQLLNCKGWEKVGFALYAGWWEDKNLWQKITESIEKLKDYELRLKMSRTGRKIVDGKGALRVAKKLIKAVQKAQKGFSPLSLPYPSQ